MENLRSKGFIIFNRRNERFKKILAHDRKKTVKGNNRNIPTERNTIYPPERLRPPDPKDYRFYQSQTISIGQKAEKITAIRKRTVR